MVVYLADLDDVGHPLFDHSKFFKFVLHELVVCAKQCVVFVELDLRVLAFVSTIEGVFGDSFDKLYPVLAG